MQRVSAPESQDARTKRLAKEAKDNATKATTLKSLQDEVTKLAEVVHTLVNQQTPTE